MECTLQEFKILQLFCWQALSPCGPALTDNLNGSHRTNPHEKWELDYVISSGSMENRDLGIGESNFLQEKMLECFNYVSNRKPDCSPCTYNLKSKELHNIRIA